MRCITVAEAAQRIGCISPALIYKLAKNQQIPVVRLGARVLIDEDDIPEIIKQFKVPAKRGVA